MPLTSLCRICEAGYGGLLHTFDHVPLPTPSPKGARKAGVNGSAASQADVFESATRQHYVVAFEGEPPAARRHLLSA